MSCTGLPIMSKPKGLPGLGSQNGSALAVVLCVMFFVIALSLSLMLSSAVLLSRYRRATQKEQCRITAATVSDVMIGEIERYRGREDPLNLLADFLAEADTQERLILTLQESTLPGETVVECYWVTAPEEVRLHMEVRNSKDNVGCTVLSCFRTVSVSEVEYAVWSYWGREAEGGDCFEWVEK